MTDVWVCSEPRSGDRGAAARLRGEKKKKKSGATSADSAARVSCLPPAARPRLATLRESLRQRCWRVRRGKRRGVGWEERGRWGGVISNLSREQKLKWHQPVYSTSIATEKSKCPNSTAAWLARSPSSPARLATLKLKAPCLRTARRGLLDAPGESHRGGLGRTEPGTPGASTSAGGLQASFTSGAQKQTGDEARGLRVSATLGTRSVSARGGALWRQRQWLARLTDTSERPRSVRCCRCSQLASKDSRCRGGCDNLTQGHNVKSGMVQTSCPAPDQAPREAEAGRRAAASPERGVCTGVVLRGESKLPECSNLQHAAWLSSARSPSRFQPPRKQELCAAPERPDAVLGIGKVGEAEPEKARAPEWMCCGFLRTSGLRVPRAGPGCRPSARQLRQQTSPPAPRPAWPPPVPSAPAAQPSVLPGGPAYLREAACPGEESSQELRYGRSDLAPSPLGTHTAAAAASHSLQSPQPHGRPRDPRAPGKSLHRRAAPRRRTAPGSAELPRPALLPARSSGARTPGRWRSQPPRLVLGAGTGLLSPHCLP